MILCFPPSVVVVFVCVCFLCACLFCFFSGDASKIRTQRKSCLLWQVTFKTAFKPDRHNYQYHTEGNQQETVQQAYFSTQTEPAGLVFGLPLPALVSQTKGCGDGGMGGKVCMGTDLPTEGAAGFIHSSVPWGQTSPQRGQQGLFIHQFHGDRPPHRGGSRVYLFISSMGTDLPTEGTAGFIHSSVP